MCDVNEAFPAVTDFSIGLSIVNESVSTAPVEGTRRSIRFGTETGSKHCYSFFFSFYVCGLSIS